MQHHKHLYNKNIEKCTKRKIFTKRDFEKEVLSKIMVLKKPNE